MESIADLATSLFSGDPRHTVEYREKMLHPIPEAPVVDRIGYLVERAKGRVVVNLGCEGILHTALQGVATHVYGVDKRTDVGADAIIDFDHLSDSFPCWPAVDLIVAGEVLEHLSNPGTFLETLHAVYPRVPLLMTVPNALSTVALAHLRRGMENVNRDHVAWYSYMTLSTLLRRAGYAPTLLGWYHGKPLTAEGLVMSADPV